MKRMMDLKVFVSSYRSFHGSVHASDVQMAQMTRGWIQTQTDSQNVANTSRTVADASVIRKQFRQGNPAAMRRDSDSIPVIPGRYGRRSLRRPCAVGREGRGVVLGDTRRSAETNSHGGATRRRDERGPVACEANARRSPRAGRRPPNRRTRVTQARKARRVAAELDAHVRAPARGGSSPRVRAR